MELSVGLVWTVFVRVEWSLAISWPLWEGVVVTDGVIGALGDLCVGGGGTRTHRGGVEHIVDFRNWGFAFRDHKGRRGGGR